MSFRWARHPWLRRGCGAILLACVAALAALGAEPAAGPDASADAATGSIPAASRPAHGLTGRYYAMQAGETWLDDDRLPVPAAAPYAVRVDPGIAFGRDSGFDKTERQLEWWPAKQNRSHLGVLWTGYVRLPKAGTYYFPTASNNASAVYVNRARITLNGIYGGHVVSDAFTIPDPQRDESNMTRSGYVVPVTVDAPRDVPIEVRFATDNLGSVGFGIDLYWVTPDSRRDAAGKPVAELIPAEALYVDAPGSLDSCVTAPAVSGPHSTISSDFLYLPQDGLTLATITVRLADKNGRGVPGKNVHLSVLSSYAPAGVVEQPKGPTDKDGIAIAKIKAGYATGDLTIFATDLTDLVDVAQVATLRAGPREYTSFFAPRSSPYYDSRGFTVEPMPPVVGQPSKIRFPVHNPKDKAVELTASFSAFEWNIGRRDLPDLGKVEGIVLQPGETKVVEGTWVPTDPSPHLCFTISLSGRYVAGGAPVFPERRLAGWDPRVAAFGMLADDAASSGSITQNIGHVIDMGVNAAKEKLNEQFEEIFGDGTVPIAPGVKLDPAKGRVAAGGSADFNVNGKKIGGFTAKGDIGAEASSDPRKILDFNFKVKGNVGKYERTLIDKSGVVPAPKIGNDIDPKTSAGPRFRQLRGLDI